MNARWLLVSGFLLSVTLGARFSGAAPVVQGSGFVKLRGEVLLDNDQVIVQGFTLEPGKSTGPRVAGNSQLLVAIRGGTLRADVGGRPTLWPDGKVIWLPADAPADTGVTNVGNQPIRFETVTLKPEVGKRDSATPGSAATHLNYPNIPGEDLLENEQVIVQRFRIAPGQWEGVHAHPPNALYIHIKGGRWGGRTYASKEQIDAEDAPDGSVGWMRTVDIGEGHESHNVGKATIDLIWVTLKR